MERSYFSAGQYWERLALMFTLLPAEIRVTAWRSQKDGGQKNETLRCILRNVLGSEKRSGEFAADYRTAADTLESVNSKNKRLSRPHWRKCGMRSRISKRSTFGILASFRTSRRHQERLVQERADAVI